MAWCRPGPPFLIIVDCLACVCLPRDPLPRARAQVSYERVEMLFPFKATRDDEINLRAGDEVHVHSRGDDGWCLGTCVRSAQNGMFPITLARKLLPDIATLQAVYEAVALAPAVVPILAAGGPVAPIPPSACVSLSLVLSSFLPLLTSRIAGGSCAPGRRDSDSEDDLYETVDKEKKPAAPRVGRRFRFVSY